jgi:HEAT repeat protein
MEDGTVKKDGDIPTTKLIENLSDPDWKVRAAAAELLGERKEKGVPEILLKVARTDVHLEAVRAASASFKSIVQGPEPSNIDIDDFNQWLKEKTGTPLDELDNIYIFFAKEAWKRRINAQIKAIGNLDIDILEQWWKEHSAEVNERLADMK